MVAEHDAEVLLVPSDGRHEEAALRMGRIGFDRVVGYVADPSATFAALSDLMGHGERIAAEQVEGFGDDLVIVDVRNAGEREEGQYINRALHIPLAELARRADEVPTDRPILVHCAGGWRSSVGASVLRAHGHERVMDLIGGFGAWADQKAAIPA